MASDMDKARREATHWHVRLREEEGDASVKADFARWLGESPLHRAAWQSLRETMSIVDQAPPAWRATAPMRHTQGRHWRQGWIAAAAAAACLLLFLLPATTRYVQADLVTPAGTVEQLSLADGSIVQLGPDSAIAVDYDDDSRTVHLLSGQAMFEVQHNPARPFQVRAGNVTTTVLGTRFDVRMLGDSTSIAVAQGHVRVDDAEDGQPAATRNLLPGDWIQLRAGQAPQMGRLAPELVGGWRKGEALAENRSIGSLIDEIQPWFKGRIFISDAEFAKQRVTGIYNVQDPERALEMIIRPHGGRITHITPWIIIISGT